MKENIKEEALNQLNDDILFGFENKEELFDSIRDMFYDEDDFDEEWLRAAISQKYEEHRKESLTWSTPTDFDRLADAFDELINNKIVALHKAGYTKQDGQVDCLETIERLEEFGIKVNGYCYYHTQDLMRAIDPDSRNLLIGFDSVDGNDTDALIVANEIITTLKKHGFELEWNGSVEQRIEIKNINWQKVPDNQEWGMQRVIDILSSPSPKKSFWKFW